MNFMKMTPSSIETLDQFKVLPKWKEGGCLSSTGGGFVISRTSAENDAITNSSGPIPQEHSHRLKFEEWYWDEMACDFDRSTVRNRVQVVS